MTVPNSPVHNHAGQSLKTLRVEHHITRRMLADRLGVHHQTIVYHENRARVGCRDQEIRNAIHSIGMQQPYCGPGRPPLPTSSGSIFGAGKKKGDVQVLLKSFRKWLEQAEKDFG